MLLRINHNSNTPLHVQVEKLLRDIAEISEYKKGKLLPKEMDIANRLGVSRNTVRQAYTKLVQEGLLERKKGIGTKVVVKNISTHLKSFMSFTKEMKDKNIEIINYKIESTKVFADDEVANALEIKEGTEVVKLIRLRGDKDGPFVKFISFFHPRIGLSGNEDFNRPLYEIIEGDYNVVVDMSRDTLKAISADSELAKSFKVAENAPVLHRSRIVYDAGKRAIEYGLVYYRADKFNYTIDIKREYND